MKSFKAIVVAILVAAMFSGCAGVPMMGAGANPNVYTPAQAMNPGRVCDAVVLQVRDVTITSGAGAQTAGAVAGALIGALAGKNTSSAKRNVMALAGAGIGALAGSQLGASKALEIVVLLSDGTSRVIVQEPGSVASKAGEHVLVLINGQQTRIVSAFQKTSKM